MNLLQQLHTSPSPVKLLREPFLDERGIQLLLKRDEQRYLAAYPGDRAFGGNKWRKLQYNLLAAREQGYRRLLTFGGAYSNHIAATASAGKLFGFQAVGIIRGEPGSDNPTLRHARRCGMHLHFIDRTTYRRKEEPEILRKIMDRFGPAYLIPEGGTNGLALRGCREMVTEIEEQLSGHLPAYICLPAGTGGTLAGVIDGLAGRSFALGFSVLKGSFLAEEVTSLLRRYGSAIHHNWLMVDRYHFGGYARLKPPLLESIRNFKNKHDIQLDPIYTGKLMYGVYDMIKSGFFPRGSTVLAIHTGGLQGIAGFEEQ
jgi:1-aminocyclopropane-1-carboxylate deaminase